MDIAFGDHQVTNYQADVEARTIGASAHKPVLYKGRWPNTNVLWNVPKHQAVPVHRLGHRTTGTSAPFAKARPDSGNDDRRRTAAV